ncbi:hypothetical protein [Pseudonocardia endophytica]|uniref:hypothetical protein n=1 Tax=Pseudonocardia endophytica TaxID=401976 RepID=UPI00105318B0|nr:hypothetical protein [Pseudonocardia endophytica]
MDEQTSRAPGTSGNGGPEASAPTSGGAEAPGAGPAASAPGDAEDAAPVDPTASPVSSVDETSPDPADATTDSAGPAGDEVVAATAGAGAEPASRASEPAAGSGSTVGSATAASASVSNESSARASAPVGSASPDGGRTPESAADGSAARAGSTEEDDRPALVTPSDDATVPFRDGATTAGPSDDATVTVPPASAGPSDDAPVTVPPASAGPSGDATVTVPPASAGPSDDATVTVPPASAGPSDDATVTVPPASAGPSDGTTASAAPPAAPPTAPYPAPSGPVGWVPGQPLPYDPGTGGMPPAAPDPYGGAPAAEPNAYGAPGPYGGPGPYGPPGAYGSPGAYGVPDPPRGAPGPYGPPPGNGGGTAVWPGPPRPEPIRRRNGKPLLIVGVVVLLLVVAGVVFFVIPPAASSAVANAADAARGWTGATYRGPLRGPNGRTVTVDVTVGPNGDKTGTFTRDGGGRADFAETGGVQLLRGNASWWSGQAQGSDKGRRLGGIWLRNPAPETTWLRAVPLLAPGALADDLTGPAGAPQEYSDAGDQAVDGQDGRVVTAAEHRVVLSDDHEARLLAIVPPASADPAGLRVSAAAPDQVAAVGSAGAPLSEAEDYSSALYYPDDVEVDILPAPPCSTPTCTVTVKLTNSAGLEARGVVTITKNGTVLNRIPFTLGPRAEGTYTATSPNAGMAAGRDVTARYEATVTAS